MKKKLVFILVAALCLSAFGCGKTEIPKESTTASTAGSTSESTTATATETATEKVDLDGYVFTLFCNKLTGLWYAEPRIEDEQAVMDMWDALEKEYNFTVEVKFSSGTPVKKYCASGEDFADVIYNDDILGGTIPDGYARRLDCDEVKAAGLNVTDASIFEQHFADAMKVGGDVYCFDICGKHRAAQLGNYFVFNKQYAEEYGYPAEVIYQAVRDHTWTWDVFYDIVQYFVRTYNEEEHIYRAYGIGLFNSTGAIASYGGGAISYVDGKYVSTLGSLVNITASKYFADPRLDLCPSILFRKTTLFCQGDILFSSIPRFDLLKECALNDIDYGIAPYPKGGSTAGYVSAFTGPTVCIIPVSNAEWVKACFVMGKVAETLGEPEAGIMYYRDYVRDEESMEMITEYILPSGCADLLAFSWDAQDIFYNFYKDIKDLSGLEAVIKYAGAFSAEVDKAFKLYNK